MAIDISIIIIILLSGIIGLKRGFTKELVCFLGFFLIIILSFILKNPISAFFYEHLPFIKFGGLFKGITSINILFYEVIAFFIVASILLLVFRLLIMATSIFEKLVKMTIILGIPSKIFGFIIGIIEGMVWSFILLYIFSLPFFSYKELEKSKMKNVVLYNTPIVSQMTKGTIDTFNEIKKLTDDYKDKKITNNEYDLESIDILLKYKVVDIKSVKYLVKHKKINIKNIEKVIIKYEEE